MRIGMRSYGVVAVLAVALALIARDFHVPLLMLSLFGLFDRFVGQPALRAMQQRRDPVA